MDTLTFSEIAASILTIASVIVATMYVLMKKPYTKLDIFIIFSLLFISILSFGYYAVVKEIKKPVSNEINDQLIRLNDVEKSLKTLIQFVESQKKRLSEAESTINKLKAEKTKIEPLVKADRKSLDAIFALQEERSSRSLWTERFMGALLGVISSLLASVIYRLISARIKKMEK